MNCRSSFLVVSVSSVFFLSHPVICLAQLSTDTTNRRTPVRDTTAGDLLREKNLFFAQGINDTVSSKRHSRKNPWIAVGLSAAVPGVGQIYNQSYWKPPLIWGFGGYWIYEWFQMNSRYKDYRTQYSQSLKQFPPFGNQYLQNLRDFYRDERDKYAWYMGVLYFLNLVDAYVGASLFDFDVGSDLGMRGNSEPRMRVTLRWKY